MGGRLRLCQGSKHAVAVVMIEKDTFSAVEWRTDDRNQRIRDPLGCLCARSSAVLPDPLEKSMGDSARRCMRWRSWTFPDAPLRRRGGYSLV